MVNELPGEIGEGDANDDLAARRYPGSVVVPQRLWLAVDRHHLIVIDVDMEGVPLVAVVADHPFRDRIDLDRLVDAVGIEPLTVDGEDRIDILYLKDNLTAAGDGRVGQVGEGDQRIRQGCRCLLLPLDHHGRQRDPR